MRSSSCPPAGGVRPVTTARGFSLPLPSSTSGLPVPTYGKTSRSRGHVAEGTTDPMGWMVRMRAARDERSSSARCSGG
jgi:hypothetical protein